MLKSYLILAVRSLLKRKGYSAINVSGLGIGIAAVILIVLYARHELTYDRFHERADRIHLVYKERITPAGTQVTRDTWMPLSERLQAEYPSIENGVRMWDDNTWFRHNDVRFKETVTFTEPSLFEVFDIELERGDASTALSEPFSAVVSQKIAQKYFGRADPLGRTVRINNTIDYTVTGVLAEIPSNSSIQIDVAVPIRSVPWYEEVIEEWGGSWLWTFILLRDGATTGQLEAAFPTLVRNIWDEEVASRTVFRLEPLTELQNAVSGNRRYAYILLGIAGIILLIAAINFANLATVRSMERASEIGMRKVLGAGRLQLARQFMGEATVLSLLALGLAMLLVKVFLPMFNGLYGLELEFRPAAEAALVPALALLAVVVGFASGVYPAIVVSRLMPVQALQGELKMGQSRLRSGLVVTQFALAIALIAATLVMRHQIDFLRTAELELDREHVVVVQAAMADFEDEEAAGSRLAAFRQELTRRPEVRAVSSASHAPGQWSGWFTFTRPQGWGDQNPLRIRRAYVDEKFFEAYGIPLIEGRAFDEDRPSDRDGAVIINQAALRAFGWPTAVGKVLESGGETYEIVGVARDYHLGSLREDIEPVLHFHRPPAEAIHNFVAVRTHPGQTRAALNAIHAAWQQVDPERELPYEFVDDTFGRLYERELRLATVSSTFTLLAILIACMGLFGLASWSVTQRVKEIGIRKVLGATVPQIVVLLSRDFVVLVGIAIVVAIPLAYLGASRWLNEFAYRIDLDAGPLLVAGALALLVALLTVGLQAGRAALADPVQSLRYE